MRLKAKKSPNYIEAAGAALLRAAKLQAEASAPNSQTQLDEDGYKRLLCEARSQLAKAQPTDDPYKFGAVKTAIEALEAVERGDTTLGGQELFRSYVEAIHGGPRAVDLGGKRVTNKLSVDDSFLRAAAIKLWEMPTTDRELLSAEAENYLKIKDLAKVVDNFNQRHDSDISKSESPQSIHMPIVGDLIENHNYRTLRDFL